MASTEIRNLIVTVGESLVLQGNLSTCAEAQIRAANLSWAESDASVSPLFFAAISVPAPASWLMAASGLLCRVLGRVLGSPRGRR